MGDFIASLFIWAAFIMIGFVCLSIFVFGMTGKSLLWRISNMSNTNYAEKWLEQENEICWGRNASNVRLAIKMAKAGQLGPLVNRDRQIVDWRDFVIENPNAKYKLLIDPKPGKGQKSGVTYQIAAYTKDGEEFFLGIDDKFTPLIFDYALHQRDWSKVREWLIKSDKEAEEIERHQS